MGARPGLTSTLLSWNVEGNSRAGMAGNFPSAFCCQDSPHPVFILQTDRRNQPMCACREQIADWGEWANCSLQRKVTNESHECFEYVDACALSFQLKEHDGDLGGGEADPARSIRRRPAAGGIAL